MLKMSYREKIVALVLIVLVIILIFVMAPIKMIRENIKSDTQKRDEVKVLYDENNRKIDEIPVIEDNIKKIYAESKDINKDFYVHVENFEIDEYIQNILNKDNDYKNGDKNTIELVETFKQDNALREKLDFFYNKPEVIKYPILENADTNGTLLKDTDPELFAKVENSVSIGTLEAQQIERHKATFSAKFTKEGLFKFLDQVKESDTGVRVTSVTIDSYRFNNLKAEELQQAIELVDLKGYTSGDITFEFYTMQQIQEPRLDD